MHGFNGNSHLHALPSTWFSELEMDCVEFVLHCAPIPYLGLSCTIFKKIWDAVETVRASRGQFRVLAEAVAALLQTLDRQYRDGKLSQASTTGAVSELQRFVPFFPSNIQFSWVPCGVASLLQEIASFIEKQSSYSFIRLLLLKSDRLALINEFHQRLTFSVNAFQVREPFKFLFVKKLLIWALDCCTSGHSRMAI